MEYNLSRWMENLDDDLLIGNVNLPGTHDSAAINRWIHTPYACQNKTITEQLQGGIRLLDARIKIKKSGGSLAPVMCHGKFKLPYFLDNEYQSFMSFRDECFNFLKKNPSEFLVVSWKVDDWNGFEKDEEKKEVYSYLDAMLGYRSYPYINSNMKVRDARGKMLVLNRLTEGSHFGPFWKWNDNTEEEDITPGGKYKAFVQDRYNNNKELFPDKHKLDLVIKAIKKKTPDNIVLNYASGLKAGLFGIYIMDDIINYLGSFEVANRPKSLGWMLFDYGLSLYESYETYDSINIEDVIIDSNFGYQKYSTKFRVEHREL